MKELIPTFPRQIAYPERKTCLTKNYFYDKLNKINGIKQKIYFSLYACNELGSFQDVQIDKISFDLDNGKCIENSKKISDWCITNNYRHCIIFSTGGCWLHIKTKNFEQLKNPKQALKNCQLDIAKKLCLSVGTDPHEDDLDFHIIGDIARVSRMPGTMDINRGLYCRSIERKDLIDIKYLKELGKTQSLKIHWYGNELLDIEKFDSDKIIDEKIEIPDFQYNYVLQDNFLDNVPPCIQDILLKEEHGTWRGRWLFTLYMKEKGFPKCFTNEIAKKYFSQIPRSDGMRNNYSHYCKVHVISLVYGNDRLIFPNCESLFQEGMCNGKCKHYNKLYR